ncbi:MAG: hydantoinase/oxoprolinase family protein [Dehalococcoidia bacterium]|nr:hydantoinase/oxoprolinase family protein [Dehalococcoidia bacterium]
MTYMVGVDSGGTFTDTVVVDSQGHITLGKAASTPHDFSQGVLDSVSTAAQALGLSLRDLLAQTRVFAHGTTVTTNALLTRHGVKAGLITTKGFEDTMIIGRVYQKAAGLSEKEIIQASRLDKADPIIPRPLIKGVTERIDYQGRELVPLDLEEASKAARELVEAGVEAIAICFLWSFMNPAHEAQVRDLVQRKHPQVFVTASSDLAPQMGEYERTATAALNCYLGPVAYRYFQALGRQLEEQGLDCPLLVMQSSGGVLPAEDVRERAVSTLSSGPVGGITGALFLGKLLGYENIICTDVGGTSFDVGLIVGGRAEQAREAIADKYHTLAPTVDVSSIGTGGGSVAWIEAGTGILRVGPQSAGAAPGPVCYDRGGVQPTVTDAGVILGYINPDYFLGGRMRLNRDRALAVTQEKIAVPLGMDVFQAAAGIYKISNSQLADLVRKVTIEKGYDPREFALFAYGGAGPQYAGLYGAEIGVRTIVIPSLASVFSAFGAVVSDIVKFHSLSDPMVAPLNPQRLNEIYRSIGEKARQDLRKDGVAEADMVVQRYVEMRYRRQVHEVRVPVPDGELGSTEVGAVLESFEKKYEDLYGKGAAFREAGMEAITFHVVGTGHTMKPVLPRLEAEGSDSALARKGSRPAYFDRAGGFVETAVYDAAKLRAGHLVPGPAVIEAATTTIVVQPGLQARVDPYLNIIIGL